MKCAYIDEGTGTVLLTNDPPESCPGYLLLEPGEALSVLPPLSVAEAEQIAHGFLLALCTVVAIKVAFKISR